MAIDDKLEKGLHQLVVSAERDPGREVIRMAIKAIPYFGGQIDRLLSSEGQRRLIARIVDVFEAVKSQVEDLDDAQVRKEYFESDEFQTLLTLILQEIQTTHDKKKLQMLAAALCNSGNIDFQSETRKELFVRVLRLLSPEHIRALNSLAPWRVSEEALRHLNDDQRAMFVTETGEALEVSRLGEQEAAFPFVRA